MDLGLPELVIILLIILLLFGSTRLPKLSRSLGQSIRELREGFNSKEPSTARGSEEFSGKEPSPEEFNDKEPPPAEDKNAKHKKNEKKSKR